MATCSVLPWQSVLRLTSSIILKQDKAIPKSLLCSCLVCRRPKLICVHFYITYIVVICVLMCLLLMPDCWLEVSTRKVLRPAISTQVFFLGFPVSLKQMLRWFPSPSCHYMLLMYPSRCKFSTTASCSCICVKNDCHRVKTQLQLNKYYYKIGKLAMFKEIIGVYCENSGKQEMTQSGNK